MSEQKQPISPDKWQLLAGTTRASMTREIRYDDKGVARTYPVQETIETSALCSVEIATRAKGPPGITVKVYASTETEAGDRAAAECMRLVRIFAAQPQEDPA